MLTIRPADVEDAAAVAGVYRPYVEQSVASFELEAPDASAMSRRMLEEPRKPWLVAERDGQVVGFAYAGAHHARPGYRWAVNVSVYLSQGEQGQGTGRALYEALLPILGPLGYVTAIAGITLPNPASVGLHEAMGFRACGGFSQVGFKLGTWYDVGWWQLSLGARPGEPGEPIGWRPLR